MFLIFRRTQYRVQSSARKARRAGERNEVLRQWPQDLTGPRCDGRACLPRMTSSSAFCSCQSVVALASMVAECRSRPVCVLCSAANACCGVRVMARWAQSCRNCPTIWLVAVQLSRCHSCAQAIAVGWSGLMLIHARPQERCQLGTSRARACWSQRGSFLGGKMVAPGRRQFGSAGPHLNEGRPASAVAQSQVKSRARR